MMDHLIGSSTEGDRVVSAAPNRARGILGTSMAVAVLAAVIGCGSEDSGQPAGQPSSPTSSTPSTTPTTPTATPSNPHGTPGPDCPQTVDAVRDEAAKATWGQGPIRFRPVGVTICQYSAEAAGQDYPPVMTKRTGQQSQDLFALVNAAPVTPSKPRVCTKDLGPTYVLRFVDDERGVLSYLVEAFGCRQLVAVSFEGQGKPGELPAPRQATPQVIKSLAER
jgi:hypothetical protein